MDVLKKFAAALLLFLLFAPVGAHAAIGRADAKRIWEKVAAPTELTELPFIIKEENTPNAWVTNGESVTVTTGLLALLETEAELYAVFGHEAGHVKLNHLQKSASKSAGLSVAAGLLSQIFGNGIGNVAVNVGANLINSGWSREQEIEADDYSVALAAANKEDPVGMYSAISRLAQVNNTQPSGFNSHPPDDRRLEHIKKTILKIKPDAEFPN
ncbi:MAG: M48 family metallopeptidase [Cloacibacillus sp.]